MRASLLYVVACHYNPIRYRVRNRTLREWISYMLDCGVDLTIVEHTIRDMPFTLDPDEDLVRHVRLIQLQGDPSQELWLQYALYNVGFARLPNSAEYLCWHDVGLRHVRHDWASEAVYMLQRYRVGQPWSHSIELGPNGETVKDNWGHETDRSFCEALRHGEAHGGGHEYAPIARALLPPPSEEGKRDWRMHTGYCWAIRKEVLRGIGRLIDWEPTGPSDYHMALAFAGMLTDIDKRLKPSYVRKLREFSARCDQHIRQDVGVMPGTVLNDWHGPKRSRFYGTRSDILIESEFDPDLDITYDVNGLPTLCTDNRKLRDGIRRYNALRNEDSIDL